MNITSANAVFMLTVPKLFPVPIQMQGFATDAAFDDEQIEIAEVMMGVDGKISAGYTPNPTKMTVSLQADSESRDIFDVWIGAQKTARTVYKATGIITMASVGKIYTCTNGVLQAVKQLPGAKKVLQAQEHVIMWESIVSASI